MPSLLLRLTAIILIPCITFSSVEAIATGSRPTDRFRSPAELHAPMQTQALSAVLLSSVLPIIPAPAVLFRQHLAQATESSQNVFNSFQLDDSRWLSNPWGMVVVGAVLIGAGLLLRYWYTHRVERREVNERRHIHRRRIDRAVLASMHGVVLATIHTHENDPEDPVLKGWMPWQGPTFRLIRRAANSRLVNHRFNRISHPHDILLDPMASITVERLGKHYDELRVGAIITQTSLDYRVLHQTYENAIKLQRPMEIHWFRPSPDDAGVIVILKRGMRSNPTEILKRRKQERRLRLVA